jgi:hypothetical protein
MWTNYQNDLIVNDHLVEANAWPAEAIEVMRNATAEPSAGTAGNVGNHSAASTQIPTR